MIAEGHRFGMSLSLKTSLLFSHTMEATLCGCFSSNPNQAAFQASLVWDFSFFLSSPFLHTWTRAPRCAITAVATGVLHGSSTASRQLWLLCPIPSSLFAYAKFLPAGVKCPARTSPEKPKCGKKGVFWISSLCQKCFREELSVPVPVGLGAPVLMPPSSSVQAASYRLPLVQKSVTAKHAASTNSLFQYKCIKKDVDINLVPAALCRMRCLLPTASRCGPRRCHQNKLPKTVIPTLPGSTCIG